MGDALKCCNVCGREYPATTEYFHRTKAMKDGFFKQCKECRGKKAKSYHANLAQRESIPLADVPSEKRCNKCHTSYPLTAEFFYRNKTNRNGFANRCRICVGKNRRSSAIVKYSREGYKLCKECEKEYPATTEYFYRDKKGREGLHGYCKRCQSAKRTITLPNDIAGIYKYCTKCQKELPATTEYFHRNNIGKGGINSECKSCKKAYQQKPEVKKRTSFQRRISQSRPKAQESKRIREHHRRAQKRVIAGNYTPAQIQDQLKRQKHKCYYCQKRLQKVKGRYIYHIEHTFPLSRVAGTDIPANSIDYIVLACPTCNLSKNNRFPWEWVEGGRLL